MSVSSGRTYQKNGGLSSSRRDPKDVRPEPPLPPRASQAVGMKALPEVDSVLFEEVSDEELALLEGYRALPPSQRARLLQAIVRMAECVRQRRHAACGP
jgi:hypothetical protein